MKKSKMVIAGEVCVGVLLCAIPSGMALANGASRPNIDLKLEANLDVEVMLSKENKQAGDWGSGIRNKVSCSQSFSGTHAGNTILFEAKAEGGVKPYKYNLIYQFPEGSYVVSSAQGESIHSITNSNGVFKVKVPLLQEHISDVTLMASLNITDARGVSTQMHKHIQISRPVILSRSLDSTANRENCKQVFPAYPMNIGRIANGTTYESQFGIKYVTENSWTQTRGWDTGVYLNPIVGYNGLLFSLISGHISYFKHTAQQHSQSVELTHNLQVSPGDVVDVYSQATRSVVAYDLELVDPCGQRKAFPGAYYLETWGTSYPVHLVNFAEESEPTPLSIGAPVTNDCSERFDRFNSNESSYLFYGLTAHRMKNHDSSK